MRLEEASAAEIPSGVAKRSRLAGSRCLSVRYSQLALTRRKPGSAVHPPPFLGPIEGRSELPRPLLHLPVLFPARIPHRRRWNVAAPPVAALSPAAARCGPCPRGMGPRHCTRRHLTAALVLALPQAAAAWPCAGRRGHAIARRRKPPPPLPCAPPPRVCPGATPRAPCPASALAAALPRRAAGPGRRQRATAGAVAPPRVARAGRQNRAPSPALSLFVSLECGARGQGIRGGFVHLVDFG